MKKSCAQEHAHVVVPRETQRVENSRLENVLRRAVRRFRIASSHGDEAIGDGREVFYGWVEGGFGRV